MKYCTFLLLALFLVGCAADAPTTNNSGVVTTPAAPNAVVPKKVDRTILAPLAGHWDAEAIVGTKSAETRENYDGAWFNLTLDQTFTFGQYESTLHQGTYTYDPSSNIIDLYFNPSDQKVANQYKIQGLGAYDGFTTIWLGNTPKNPDGMQVKMVKKLD